MLAAEAALSATTAAASPGFKQSGGRRALGVLSLVLNTRRHLPDPPPLELAFVQVRSRGLTAATPVASGSSPLRL